MVIYGANIKDATDLSGWGGGGMTTKLHERACVCRINVLSENKAHSLETCYTLVCAHGQNLNVKVQSVHI